MRLTPEEIIAAATAINSLILVAAAIFAWRQVKVTKKTTEAQMRPYVVVDLDWSNPPIMRIYVANIGRTLARNVTMKFEPPLQSSIDSDETRIADIELFSKPQETLAPGKRIETFFDLGPSRAKRKDELADSYAVTVSYEGIGLSDEVRHYTERQTVNVGVLWGLQYSKAYTLKDIADRLDKITKALGRK